MNMTKEIAECVGLWLAEGDSKTKSEVTFTNNCIELILFFHEHIHQLYSGKNKPRIYIYSPAPRTLITNLNGFVIRNYSDVRAKRTYYIYRLADVQFVKEWKRIVSDVKDNEKFYPEVLRGIFAGEGNVKHDLKNKNSRNLRVASGKRDPFIEKLLEFFNVPIKYTSDNHMYLITGRHLEKLNDINIAVLHPEKESKFRKMIDSVKEKHYSPGEFKKLLFGQLDSFQKTKDLAKFFNKSVIYTLETLTELKRENVVSNIKRKDGSFWAKKHLIKEHFNSERVRILHNIKKYQTFSKTGKAVNLSRRTVARRVREYQKDGLIAFKNACWEMTEKGKVIVGVDEAGSFGN
ncbi:helix-turn-helix domain-containing protein [Candidatus Woesearchaeota archaeon]|jgi:hypothetical protein|nr:helix-turn-helix domain-containing protein [Candidatus Woesearchaeota archaeon]MBT5342803.1 helix-turn-helix domain-containing protein [Candidatus Woesearchaeota archaeon]